MDRHSMSHDVVIGPEAPDRTSATQDLVYRLPGMHLLGRSVNKGKQRMAAHDRCLFEQLPTLGCGRRGRRCGLRRVRLRERLREWHTSPWQAADVGPAPARDDHGDHDENYNGQDARLAGPQRGVGALGGPVEWALDDAVPGAVEEYHRPDAARLQAHAREDERDRRDRDDE